jgi:hypothetical protein
MVRSPETMVEPIPKPVREPRPDKPKGLRRRKALLTRSPLARYTPLLPKPTQLAPAERRWIRLIRRQCGGCVWPGCPHRGEAHHLLTRGAHPEESVRFAPWNGLELCRLAEHHDWIQHTAAGKRLSLDLAAEQRDLWERTKRLLTGEEIRARILGVIDRCTPSGAIPVGSVVVLTHQPVITSLLIVDRYDRRGQAVLRVYETGGRWGTRPPERLTVVRARR